ncbi:hypothetical protein CVT26_007803 [Gymnopilus dilepis]|uniref:F-box domain-containing protein n=1 Tax=Gymnopilus dilepis TaxID=231916 RepID=A0A409W895_9AGAR|nr:hypothetical protein CVT26_007803 [Gymnopilus dilepis]
MLESTLVLPSAYVVLSTPSVSGKSSTRPFDGVQLPTDVVDKIVRHLGDDSDTSSSGGRLELEKNLSACAEASHALRHSARAVRYKEMKLELIQMFKWDKLEDTIKVWSDYVEVIVPHLRDLTVDWNIDEIMADARVTTIVSILERAPLHGLYMKGPFSRLPDVLYPLARKDTLVRLSFQYIQGIPRELVVCRDGLHSLRLIQAKVDVLSTPLLSDTMSFDFDHSSEKLSQFFRRPKSLLLQLDGTNTEGNILLETYCTEVDELTLEFPSEVGYEYLRAVSHNVLAKLGSLCLTFQRGGELVPPFDVLQWLQITGATNITNLGLTFTYDAADDVDDVKEVLEYLSSQPQPSFDVANLFSTRNLPKLEQGEITLKFSLNDYDAYEKEELSSIQEEAQAVACKMFGTGGLVTVKGLLEAEDDAIMYML